MKYSRFIGCVGIYEKKNFGRIEKGCIFALAFKRKRRVDKEGTSSLKFLRQEIACVGGPHRGAGIETRDEFRYERTILTMKSLILAQDER